MAEPGDSVTWVWVRSSLRPWWVIRTSLASWQRWKRFDGRKDKDWHVVAD